MGPETSKQAKRKRAKATRELLELDSELRTVRIEGLRKKR